MHIPRGQERAPDLGALLFRQVLSVQDGGEIAADLTVAGAGPREGLKWIGRLSMAGRFAPGLATS